MLAMTTSSLELYMFLKSADSAWVFVGNAGRSSRLWNEYTHSSMAVARSIQLSTCKVRSWKSTAIRTAMARVRGKE